MGIDVVIPDSFEFFRYVPKRLEAVAQAVQVCVADSIFPSVIAARDAWPIRCQSFVVARFRPRRRPSQWFASSS